MKRQFLSLLTLVLVVASNPSALALRSEDLGRGVDQALRAVELLTVTGSDTLTLNQLRQLHSSLLQIPNDEAEPMQAALASVGIEDRTGALSRELMTEAQLKSSQYKMRQAGKSGVCCGGGGGGG